MRGFFSILSVGLFSIVPAVAQLNQAVYNQVRDSIITRFNRDDFKGIYQLADTAFSKGIAETRLISYLKSNRNSGNIGRVISQDTIKGGVSYRLAFEIRDMDMFLKVTPEGKFSSFGLSNAPIVLREKAPQVQNSNPLKTALDRSMDSLASDYFRDPRARGLSIGLIKDGKHYAYHYGDARKDSHLLPTSLTIYEIGSVTKTFTATLLARAVVDQKVSLSDDIRQYLPGQYPNLSYQDRPITLQDLANHTSGLAPMPPNIGNQPGYNPATPEVDYDSTLFYQALHAVKLDTVPGYKFNYSNWGTAVLGHILETLYHSSYAQLLEAYITTPLGMVHTTYQRRDEDKNRMALPYSENGNVFSFQDEGFLGPAGDIHADLADMLQYLQAQLDETEPAIKLTHQPTQNNTGLGWGVRTNGQYRDIQHNGSTPGFTAHISGFPEYGSGCVILTNSKANLNQLIVRTQAMLKQNER